MAMKNWKLLPYLDKKDKIKWSQKNRNNDNEKPTMNFSEKNRLYFIRWIQNVPVKNRYSYFMIFIYFLSNEWPPVVNDQFEVILIIF